jgi:hypothetical protein
MPFETVPVSCFQSCYAQSFGKVLAVEKLGQYRITTLSYDNVEFTAPTWVAASAYTEHILQRAEHLYIDEVDRGPSAREKLTLLML